MFKKAKALFEAVKTKLTKTSNELRSSITSVFKQKVEVDDKILDDLQESLILADVSFNSSQEIIQNFTRKSEITAQLKKIITKLQSLATLNTILS